MPETKVISSIAELETMEVDHNRLFEACPDAHIYSSSAFVFSYIKANWVDADWVYVATYRNGQMVACAFGKRRRVRKWGLGLQFLSLGIEGFSDALVHPDNAPENLASLLLAIHNIDRNWLVLEFSRVQPLSFSRLVQCSRESGLKRLEGWAGFGFMIDVNVTEEALLRSMSRKSRQEIRRRMRRLCETHDIGFDTYRANDPQINENYLDEFMRLEDSGWKGRAGTSLSRRDGQKDYVCDIVKQASRQGQVCWHRLICNGAPIAISLRFSCHGRYWLFKTAYDESLSRYGPGVLLCHQMILGCLDNEDIHEINCISAPEWMEAWNPEKVRYRSIMIFRQGVKGSFFWLVASLWRGLRGLLTHNSSGAAAKDQRFR